MMRSFVLAFAMALSLVAIALAAPPYPCTFTDSTGRSYDLSNMWRNPSVNVDYTYNTSLYVYDLNICGNSTQRSCDGVFGICQTATASGVGWGGGLASAAQWATLTTGDGVLLTYPSGDVCATGQARVTHINVTCDSTLTTVDGVIDSITEPTTCSYAVNMRSQWACSGGSSSGSSGSRSNVQYLSGGLPFCTQCGNQGQYACSANNIGQWKSSFAFTDPVPKGSVVSRVDIILQGAYACNTTLNVVEVDINGVPVNIQQSFGSNACACNTCDGNWLYTAIYSPFNLPNYKYGGSNTVNINVLSGQTCLYTVNTTVYWDPPVNPGTTAAIVRWNLARYAQPRVCNSFGYDNSASISLSFTDPLPSGALLLQATVQIFGSFWCYSSSSVAPTFSAQLVSTQIGSSKLPSKSMSNAVCGAATQCDGSTWTTTSALYMGWPGYKYGQPNILSIQTSYYPRIGQVALFLTYYSPSSKKPETLVYTVQGDE